MLNINKIKTWLVAATIRAVKTAAQVAVASVGVASVLSDVDWRALTSTVALSALLSLLTSLAGLPELKKGKDDDDSL